MSRRINELEDARDEMEKDIAVKVRKELEEEYTEGIAL